MAKIPFLKFYLKEINELMNKYLPCKIIRVKNRKLYKLLKLGDGLKKVGYVFIKECNQKILNNVGTYLLTYKDICKIKTEIPK